MASTLRARMARLRRLIWVCIQPRRARADGQTVSGAGSTADGAACSVNRTLFPGAPKGAVCGEDGSSALCSGSSSTLGLRPSPPRAGGQQVAGAVSTAACAACSADSQQRAQCSLVLRKELCTEKTVRARYTAAHCLLRACAHPRLARVVATWPVVLFGCLIACLLVCGRGRHRGLTSPWTFGVK